jgi:hypothetical protein
VARSNRCGADESAWDAGARLVTWLIAGIRRLGAGKSDARFDADSAATAARAGSGAALRCHSAAERPTAGAAAWATAKQTGAR